MSGSGNMIPQSSTMIRPSTSTQAQLRPISPRPPKKTMRTGAGPPRAGPDRRRLRWRESAAALVAGAAFFFVSPARLPLDPRRRPPPSANPAT